MNVDFNRIVRGAVALVVLAVLVSVVSGWWREYRAASEPQRPGNSQPATPTVESTATPSAQDEGPAKKPAPTEAAKPDGKSVTILINGLNFRAEPSANGTPIMGLDKGDKVTLIKTEGGWHNVRTSEGRVGWISSNPQYSKVEE